VCLIKDPAKRPSAEQLLAENPFIRSAKSKALIGDLVATCMEEIERYREANSVPEDDSSDDEKEVKEKKNGQAAPTPVKPQESSKDLWNKAVQRTLEVRSKKPPPPPGEQSQPDDPSKVKPHLGTLRQGLFACKWVQVDFTGAEREGPYLDVYGKCRYCGKVPREHAMNLPAIDTITPGTKLSAQELQRQFQQKHLKQLEVKYRAQRERQEQLELEKTQARTKMREEQLSKIQTKYAALAARSRLIEQQKQEKKP
jgi:hypothetical protein